MSLPSLVLRSAALALDVGRAILALPEVEWGRRRGSPGHVIERLRARGLRERRRSDASRARLVRAIALVDRAGPGGPNCLRRTLLRVALDRAAAEEPVVLGLNLRTEDGARGHAWVDRTESPPAYDVEFRV